jgi:hypothetical protein
MVNESAFIHPTEVIKEALSSALASTAEKPPASTTVIKTVNLGIDPSSTFCRRKRRNEFLVTPSASGIQRGSPRAA